MAQNVDLNNTKYQMLREIFPEDIKSVNFAIIDMDVTMLSVADILRNIDRSFPRNSSSRNAIANGQMAVAVLCYTEYLKPLKGLIIVVCEDGSTINIKSKDYIVMGISENTISSNDKILDMLDKLTSYLIKNYSDIIASFEKFYTYFIYDAYELELEDAL